MEPFVCSPIRRHPVFPGLTHIAEASAQRDLGFQPLLQMFKDEVSKLH